jgi:hypothetical protein
MIALSSGFGVLIKSKLFFYKLQLSRELRLNERKNKNLMSLKSVWAVVAATLTIWIQHSWDIQVLLCNVKCSVQVLQWIVL